MLWQWAVESHRLFSLACVEKGEWYLRAVAVVKPVRGMAIRFLGSATARPLEANRFRLVLPQLRSALRRVYTKTERWSVSVMVLGLFLPVLLCLFSDMKYKAVVLFFVIFPKIKIWFTLISNTSKRSSFWNYCKVPICCYVKMLLRYFILNSQCLFYFSLYISCFSICSPYFLLSIYSLQL